MNVSRFGLVALLLAWIAVVAATSNAAQTQSVNEGVFTEAQAARGAEAYTAECSSCHGEGLDGDGFAPALAGPEFISNWNGTTVGDLFDRVRISMPPDQPGSVSAATKADIVTHMLKFNRFPAGQTELAKNVEPLKQIRIELPKP